MELLQVLKTRKSCRQYLEGQISDADLDKIILAGNTAPVGMGRYQNIQMTVVQNADMLNRISSECSESWNGKTFDPRYGAPTLIIVSEIPEKADIQVADVACVVENMHLMATDLGLGSIYLWGFIQYLKDNEKLKADLGIAVGYVPVSALAVGYSATPLQVRDYSVAKIKTNYVR